MVFNFQAAAQRLLTHPKQAHPHSQRTRDHIRAMLKTGLPLDSGFSSRFKADGSSTRMLAEAWDAYCADGLESAAKTARKVLWNVYGEHPRGKGLVGALEIMAEHQKEGLVFVRERLWDWVGWDMPHNEPNDEGSYMLAIFVDGLGGPPILPYPGRWHPEWPERTWKCDVFEVSRCDSSNRWGQPHAGTAMGGQPRLGPRGYYLVQGSA